MPGMGLVKQAKLLWADVRAMRRGLPANQYELGRLGGLFSVLRDHARMEVNGNGIEQLGHFDAGGTGRLLNDWTTNYGTPYGNLSSQWKNLIARSQKLCDNDPHAAAVLNTLTNNVIGKGIRPKARVKTADGKPVEGINKRLDELWKRWNDEVDASRQETFYEMQKTAFNQIVTDGAVLSNVAPADEAAFFKVQVQTLSTLRLDAARDIDNPELSSNPRVKQTAFGINLSENGAPISYWIQGKDTPIAADNLWHHYRKTKVEQFTAAPWMVAALIYLMYNSKLIEDKLVASRIQAMIGLFVTDSMWAQLIGNQTVATGNAKNPTALAMEPGKVYHGRTKDDVPQVVQADDSIQNVLMPLQRVFLHAIAMTQGISYQTVTRDLEKVNMASGRINTNADRKAFRVFQQWFAKRYCQPNYNLFVQRAFFEGHMPGKSLTDYLKNPWHYQQVQWRPQGFDFIDPSREATASVELHGEKMLTLEEYYGEKGIDWKDALQQWADEQAFAKSIGLKDPAPKPAAAPAREPVPIVDPDDDSEDPDDRN